jgi:hypothetical protein
MFFNTMNLRLTTHNIQISSELREHPPLLNDMNVCIRVD